MFKEDPRCVHMEIYNTIYVATQTSASQASINQCYQKLIRNAELRLHLRPTESETVY